MDSTFRSPRGLLGLTMVAGALLLAVPAVAAADTFTVNDDDVPGDVGPGGACGPRDATTIGEAVTGGTTGDVIRVCAGSYNESVFASPEMQFLGAQAGVDARDRAVPESQESIVTVDDGDGTFALSGSEDLIVDGFTITGNPSGPGVELSSGSQVVNNVISNNSSGVFGTADLATIRHNRLFDNDIGGNGIGVFLGLADGSVVAENRFEGGHDFASIVLGLFVDAGQNIHVTGNEVIEDAGIGVLGGADIEIADNVLTTLSDGVPGIAVEASADVEVTRNVLDDPRADTAGITLFGDQTPSTFVDITRNTVLGDGDEAGISILEDAHDGEVDVHFNRIAGNDLGIYHDDSSFVDARENWWGCNEGPEGLDCNPIVLDNVGVVDFDPWLVLGASADPTSIATGGESSQITADLLTNSDGEAVTDDFPDGAQVDFATGLGTIDPLFDLTENSVAATTLTSGEQTGTANVDATLDNETVSTAVEFTEESEPPACTERIDGTAGNDRLNGTEGSELIRGRGGRDKVKGLGADDCVKGGSGPDKVVGGPGEDRIRGGAGDDKVKARDGEADVVRCGAGDDRAKVDGADNVRGCEKVKRG